MIRRLTLSVACVAVGVACDKAATPPTAPTAPTMLVVAPGATFSTIQSALNATKGGEIVEVRAGTYGERVVIDRPVTLRGVQAIVDGRAGGLDGKDIGIRVRASHVTVSGFIVQNFERGIVIEGGSQQTIRDNEIRNNVSTAAPPLTAGKDWFEGLVVRDVRQAELVGNNIHDNGGVGLLLSGASGENVVRGNRFSANGTQVLPGCLSAGIIATGDNQLIDNEISGSTWGIYAEFGASGSVIRQNRIHGNVRSGIHMIGSNNRIEENDARDNNVIIRMLLPFRTCAELDDVGFDLFDFGSVSNTWTGNLGVANFVQPATPAAGFARPDPGAREP